MTYAVEYRDRNDGRHYLAIAESWHHAQHILSAFEDEEWPEIPPTSCVEIDFRKYPRLYKGKPVVLANRVGSRIKTDTSFNNVRVEYDIIPDVYPGA